MHFLRETIDIVTNTHSNLAYLSLFLISFLDTLIIIGAFFPASFFIMAAGFFAVHTHLNIWVSGLVVVVGGLLGDIFSYWVGTKGVNWFKNERKLLKASYVEKGQKFFNKFGDKGIIIGRFLGILKSIIPFVAGLMKMDFKRFFFLNLIAGFVWTVAHLGIGYILGKSLTLFYIPKDIRLMVILIPIALFFVWSIYEYRIKIGDLLKNKIINKIIKR